MLPQVKKILEENALRLESINAKFNPITGEGSPGGKRVRVEIKGFPMPVQWLPEAMMKVPLVKQLVKAGSVSKFFSNVLNVEETEDDRVKLVDKFMRVRIHHDFAFWAAAFVKIKKKGGGEDVLFRLTRPQRRFVEVLEAKRTSNQPIRLVLLKARQWGGSTTSQLYMVWLQLVHRTGLNSLIIAHQTAGSDEIKDMFDRMIKEYPLELLYPQGAEYTIGEKKIEGVGISGSIHRVPQRNCKIKLGTAEKPNSCRGGDYNLVHCSEVGIWRATEGKSPGDIVRSACAGILLKPYTMIIYESTANGSGNFFQFEYDAAKKGESQFDAMFISWFDIDQYSIPFGEADDMTQEGLAQKLWENRKSTNSPSNRAEPGAYLWKLWEYGATLEAIHWYINERAKYSDHGQMAAEYPSDDVEAFVHSGARVFDAYRIEELKKAGVRDAIARGEVYANGDEGKAALENLRFKTDTQGALAIWKYPDIDPDEKVVNRYLVVVDVGGRSNKADYSVVTVFDRIRMIDGGPPEVVAQWYGHTDIDILAWKAAQIAAWYDDALLVIESNTLETHDKERQVDGDQSQFILNQIKEVYTNLYARKQSEEDIIEGMPRKYGFHTNVSTKPMIISTLVKAIRDCLYVERDAGAIDEFITYEKKKNGSFGAIIGKHDDRLMTRAIGLHICFYEMDVPRFVPRPKSDHKRVRKNKAVSAATI